MALVTLGTHGSLAIDLLPFETRRTVTHLKGPLAEILPCPRQMISCASS